MNNYYGRQWGYCQLVGFGVQQNKYTHIGLEQVEGELTDDRIFILGEIVNLVTELPSNINP